MTSPAADAARADAPVASAHAVPADRRWRLRHLPVPLAESAAVLVGAAVVAWALDGGVAAAGAAAGVALVALGFVGSTLAVAWADSVAPRLVLAVGLAAYVMKLSVIGAVMMLAAAAGWPGLIPMAWGIVAGVVAWTTAHITWLVRTSGTSPR